MQQIDFQTGKQQNLRTKLNEVIINSQKSVKEKPNSVTIVHHRHGGSTRAV